MAKLRFCAFNNYYNREVKKFDTPSNYNAYKLLDMDNYDFNPNDGVTAEVILNDFTGALGSREPDYLVVWETGTPDFVISRWFVMDLTRTRGGQWKVALRRDVIVDNYNDILNAPAFIEKGYLNYDNPLIFNSENMTFNQIKKSETLLKDETQCPWLVGYYAKKDAQDADYNLKGEFQFKPVIYENWNHTMEDWEYYDLAGMLKYHIIEPDKYKLRAQMNVFRSTGTGSKYDNLKIRSTGSMITVEPGDAHTIYRCANTSDQYLNNIRPAVEENKFAVAVNTLITGLPSGYDLIPSATRTIIQQYNGKYVKTSDDKYYKITFESKTDTFAVPFNPDSEIVNNFETMRAAINSLPYTSIIKETTPETNTFEIGADDLDVWQLRILDVTSTILSEATYQFDTTGRRNTESTVYNMFCVPYFDGSVLTNTGTTFISNVSKELQLKAVTEIADTTDVYDVQFLPYCPIPGIFKTSYSGAHQLKIPYGWDAPNYIDPDDLAYRYNMTLIYPKDVTPNSGNVKGVIFHCQFNSFSKSIAAGEPELVETNPIERKVKALTRFTRICSPNYASAFEFNKQKNDGCVDYQVKCTYKPYNPYIHIAPYFAGLYGGNYNDNRGLICRGQFSIDRAGDQWEEYALQNKNYENIFNREIEYMESQNKWQNINNGINAGVGVLQGAAGGAGIGMMVGGPIGGAIGAGIGAAGSLIGGAADIAHSIAQQGEALDYKRDMFGMQLDNIKALPQTLTNVSTFDIDNKIFPFIEEYGATEVEEEALRNKLKYNGMTIGVIGTIADYMGSTTNYIKAQPIIQTTGTYTNPNANSIDNHMANSIADELNKGVRI